MVFDAGVNQKDVLDAIIVDRKHFLTRKRLNKSDDMIFAGFSEDSWESLDVEKGEYCLKKVFPSRVNYYFFSWELRELEMKGVEKKVKKKLKEAKDLQNDIEKGKKLKKRYQIDNVLIKTTISLQTKLAEISESDLESEETHDSTSGKRPVGESRNKKECWWRTKL